MYGPTAGERYLFPSSTYYRFHLRNDITESGRTQHELLIELDRPGNRVYYIAPGFYYEQHWRRIYRCRQVVQNSILFSPAVLGPLDSTQNHVVVFESANSPFGWLCSEPERREASPGKVAIEELKRAATRAPRLTIDRLTTEAARLSRALEVPLPEAPPVLPHLAEEFGWDRETIQGMSVARQLASIARSHLDCTLAIVGPE